MTIIHHLSKLSNTKLTEFVNHDTIKLTEFVNHGIKLIESPSGKQFQFHLQTALQDEPS